MPENMYLRSTCDWHLDPLEKDTIERFLQTKGLTPADVEPLSRNLYLDYIQWFRGQKQIESLAAYIHQLDRCKSGTHRFLAVLDDGQTILAKRVVVALGFKYFKNTPQDLVNLLPVGRFSHTCDTVDFAPLKGKRCLIIGGRQSAFEWTALLHEAGADAIHVSHRHDSPVFAEADWSWVNPLVDAMVKNPSWFRNLSPEEKNEINHRLWAEGRLKVEPWLEPRVMKETVKLWPNTRIVSCDELPGSDLLIKLDNNESMTVDHIILATGYKVAIDRIPFLANGRVLDDLVTNNGYPVLDEHFQTNIPGLFMTSMAATQDFGPFFAFTISVRTSAKLIGQMLIH
jgi:thioredoxin reductase